MVKIGAWDNRCWNISDPVNLLFQNKATFPGVTAHLTQLQWILLTHLGNVNFGRGNHFAASLYLCDINRLNPKREDAQFVTGPWWDRFHIRLWEVAGLHKGMNYHSVITSSVVVAAAHHEVFAFPGVHRVTAHESGKWRVAFDFALSASGWIVKPDAVFTDNFNVVPFSNEYATVISR